MKFSLALACLVSSTAFAQSSACINMRSNSRSLDTTPSTCLDTSMFDQAIMFRDRNDLFKNTMRGFIGEFPGSSTFTAFMDELSKHDDYIPFADRQVRAQLASTIEAYQQNVTLSGNSNSPDSHYAVLRDSIQYSLELNKLLEKKNLKPEERDYIQKASQDILQIGQLMNAKLNADFNNYSKKKQEELDGKLKELQTIVKEKLKLNDLSNILKTVNDINEKLGKVDSRLTDLQKNADQNQNEIAQLKKEREELKEKLGLSTKTTIQDIKNYSQFAQGMTAVYSLFNPAEAAKINNAISGLTNMAIAYTTLSELGTGAMSGAALGPYGMMAMGAVQLFNSFGSNNSSNEAFKAIFAQLKMISRQISDLQERMDKKFYYLEGSILQMERNILSRLDNISNQIYDLNQMMEYSIVSLNEINANLNDLTQFTVNQSIKRTIKDDYLKTVESCLGKNSINVKLSKNGITECLNKFHSFLTEEANSVLMTQKKLGQRSQFEWQINDVSLYLNTVGNQSFDTKLTNPELLKDIYDNVNFMKTKNEKKFSQELLAHPLFETLEQEREKLKIFAASIKKDSKTISAIKENYKNALMEIHAKVRMVKVNEENKIIKPYSVSLNNFRNTLNEELIRRGETTDQNEAYTNEILKEYVKMSDSVKYDRDPQELLDANKIIVFAESCEPNDPMNLPIPVRFNYLKQVLGEDLAKRFVMNPEKSKLCFSLSTERNKQLYTFNAIGMVTRLAEYEDALKKNPLLLMDVGRRNCIVGFIITCEETLKMSYRGEFLKSFTLKGTFNGSMLINDTFQMDEILPMRKGATDKFALLTVLAGKRYARNFAPPKGKELKLKSYRPSYTNAQDSAYVASASLDQELQNVNGGLLMPGMNFSTPSEILNVRNYQKSFNHAELIEAEKRDHNVSILKNVGNLLETQVKTTKLDHLGNMLAATVYFKGDIDSDEILKSNLSETWGLRSGRFLKQFYMDVLSADTSSASLEYVLENQLKHLEEIH